MDNDSFDTPGITDSDLRDNNLENDSSRPQSELPERPFVTGVFSFLFDPAAILSWMMLTAMAFVVLQTYIYSQGSSGIAMLSNLVLIPMGIVLAFVGSVMVLSIIQETANGYAKIQNWPNANFLDSTGEFFYMVNSLCIGFLPGGLVGYALHLYGDSIWLIFRLGTLTSFFFLPPVLLSMLASQSAFSPVSWSVWSSTWRISKAWGTFYLLAILLWVCIYVAHKLLGYVDNFLFDLLMAAGIVIMLMLYARLLGRLGWVILDDASKVGSEEDTSTDNDQRTDPKENQA